MNAGGNEPRSIELHWAIKSVIALGGIAAIMYVSWLLITATGIGTFPDLATGATDATRVGSYMIRLGLIIIVVSAAVALAAQLIAVLWAKPSAPGALGIDPIEFIKALAELIKTPAGMGFGVALLGVLLMFPSVFATE